MSNKSNTTSTDDEQPNPDPHYMSDQTYFTLMQQYLALPNIGSDGYKKRFMLRLMGLEERRIEELCKPMEYTREQCMKDVAEYSLNHQRMLRKMDKERKHEEERRTVWRD